MQIHRLFQHFQTIATFLDFQIGSYYIFRSHEETAFCFSNGGYLNCEDSQEMKYIRELKNAVLVHLKTRIFPLLKKRRNAIKILRTFFMWWRYEYKYDAKLLSVSFSKQTKNTKKFRIKSIVRSSCVFVELWVDPDLNDTYLHFNATASIAAYTPIHVHPQYSM